MFTLKIRNHRGEIYELTHNRQQYSVVNVSGLTLPQCDVHISDAGTQDGGEYNSSHLNPRNIVITLALEGDIETNRQQLYRMFPLHSPVTLFYRTYNRDLHIDGYPEVIDGSLFERREMMQISVICPDPYFRDAYPITARTTEQAALITNKGDTEIGFTAEIRVETDTPPEVTLAKYQDTMTAVYPYMQNMFLHLTAAYNASLNGIGELMADDTDITAYIQNAESVVKQDDLSGTGSEDLLHITLGQGAIGHNAYGVSYEIMSDSGGGSVSGISCTVYTSTVFDYDGTRLEFYDCKRTDGTPGAQYASGTDVLRVYLKNAQGWQEKSITDLWLANAMPDNRWLWYSTGQDLIAAGYTEGKLVVYHDANSTDIRSTLQLTHHTGSISPNDWYAHCYSVLPAGYDPDKDVPYIDSVRTTADVFSDIYISPGSGGSIEAYTIIDGSSGAGVVFAWVHSLSGEDVRSRTDEEIEAGLAGTSYLHNVVLKNETTDKQIAFASTRFQIGDVVELSTVPGHLDAKITERAGEPVSISLLYDVLHSGEFFTLVQSANRLVLTADEGAEMLSASFQAQQLWGGV